MSFLAPLAWLFVAAIAVSFGVFAGVVLIFFVIAMLNGILKVTGAADRRREV